MLFAIAELLVIIVVVGDVLLTESAHSTEVHVG